MKNPRIAYLLYVCRNARSLMGERPVYAISLREAQHKLLHIRKANRLRALITAHVFDQVARPIKLPFARFGNIGALPSVAHFPSEYGWQDPEMGLNFAEVAKRWLTLGEVEASPRNKPVPIVDMDTGVRDYQVSAIDDAVDALSAITPGKYLAAMADCGKTPTGRIEIKFEPVLHQLPSLTQVLYDSEGQPFGVSTGYQITEEKCPQMFGRVHRTNYQKSQEDYAKFEITRLTGFKFDHGPAEMTGDELLAIFNAGVNLGRML